MFWNLNYYFTGRAVERDDMVIVVCLQGKWECHASIPVVGVQESTGLSACHKTAGYHDVFAEAFACLIS